MKNYFWTFIYIGFSLFFISQAQAYPDFIGYGYSSCITCHYNGHGGGALNDYGRALFATEITARDIFPKKMEEEDIAAKSGFLGSKQLPWWFRPGAKYRGLWIESNPGASVGKQDHYYNMQADLNLNFFFDKKQKYALITTVGYTVYPRQWGTSTETKTPYWFAKEYYLRYQYSKNFWIYLGQLDKVFGIRQVDHTAVSRQPIGFGQFDQSQGMVLHWTYPTWDVALNAFVGNGDEKKEVKQKGASVSGEYEAAEKFKVGASVLSSSSEVAEWKRLAVHSRLGLSKGSALLSEGGFFENKDKTSNLAATTGAYAILESLTPLRRGYNLLSVLQYAKANIKSAGAERASFSIGALIFPLPRTEFRLMAVNGKTYDENAGTPDSWMLESQLHFSW